MTKIDTAKRFLRKIDALMLDLTTEVDIDGLPEEAGKAIVMITNNVKLALEILESEED
ncbi:MAG TPA: hypothetical protein VI935_09510 [Thermodesulfobacteriota bacterium]|nr:hypothetical protein [Thermodesulfobacteriota bacterium]